MLGKQRGQSFKNFVFLSPSEWNCEKLVFTYFSKSTLNRCDVDLKCSIAVSNNGPQDCAEFARP